MSKYVYPIDVYSSTKNEGIGTRESKMSFAIGMGLIGFVLLVIITYVLVKDFLGGSLILTGVIILVIALIVGFIIFNLFVFRSSERQAESKSMGSDNFGRFYGIRKDIETVLQLDNGDSIPVYQYGNGSPMVCLELRYGSSNSMKARGSREMYEDLFNIIGTMGYSFHTLTLTERYETTKEYQKLKNYLNVIEDKNLARVMLQITDHLVSHSRHSQAVIVDYIFIYGGVNRNAYMMTPLLEELYGLITISKTSFREPRFINGHEINEVIREYYGLEAIDMHSIKTINIDENKLVDFRENIKTYSVKTNTGKTIVDVDEEKALTKTRMKEIE